MSNTSIENQPLAKVAFITGANRGIGFETARELGEQGITVILGSRDLKKGEAAADQLKTAGINAQAVHFDAETPATYDSVYQYLQKNFGQLDILVNNAGIAKEALFGKNNSSTVSQEVLKSTFETNFFSVILLTQTLLPLLRKSPAGRIVNLSSVLASLTLHSLADSPIGAAKGLAYNASKTALNAFTVHLAHELRETTIKVNSAHPGWVKTELGGASAPMEVVDSAKTSVQLATLNADGLTGAFLHAGEALPW